VLGTRQVQLFTQDFEEGFVHWCQDLNVFTVDVKLQDSLHNFTILNMMLCMA
jgi:hypothetical protein